MVLRYGRPLTAGRYGFFGAPGVGFWVGLTQPPRLLL